MTISTLDTPSIYVACLSAYNSGRLHGEWIDATQEPEDIHTQVEAMLKASPVSDAEEWAIHDYSGFCGYPVSEYSSFEDLSEIAQVLDQDDDGELLCEIMLHLGGGTTLRDAKEFLENNYRGLHKDLEEYAMDWCEDTGMEIPDHLTHYIDYAAMGRDWELSGDIFTLEIGNDMHVFSNQ